MVVESRNFINSCIDLNFEIINLVALTIYQIVLNLLFIILLYASKYQLFISLRHQADISIYSTLWAFSECTCVVSRVDARATHCSVVHCSLSREWVVKDESRFYISAESGQFPDYCNSHFTNRLWNPPNGHSCRGIVTATFILQFPVAVPALYMFQFLTRVSSAQEYLIKISKTKVLPGLSPHAPPPTLPLQAVLILAFSLALLSGTSLDKDTSCQGRGVRIRNMAKNMKTERR